MLCCATQRIWKSLYFKGAFVCNIQYSRISVAAQIITGVRAAMSHCRSILSSMLDLSTDERLRSAFPKTMRALFAVFLVLLVDSGSSLPVALNRQAESGDPSRQLLSDDDVNECLSGNPCGANSHCVNTDGSFLCVCDEGYENLECKELCPTYDFLDSMYKGGAHLSVIKDCPLCQSTYALELNGVDQFLELGTTRIGGDYSVAVWAYLEEYTNHARIMDFFNQQWGKDNILISAGWGGSSDTRQHAHHSVRIGWEKKTDAYAADAFPSGSWVHITVTVLSASNAFLSTIYYNGERNGPQEVAIVNSGVPTLDRVFSYIGKDGWGGGEKWNGRLADFRVYNKVLDAEEVRNIYLGTHTYPNVVDPLIVGGMACSGQCARPSDTTCTKKEFDFCTPNPCDEKATCHDEPSPSLGGSCSCNSGYIGDGYSCEWNPCGDGRHQVDQCARWSIDFRGENLPGWPYSHANYVEKSSGNMAFHMSVRPGQGVVVFNSRVNGHWQAEERKAIPNPLEGWFFINPPNEEGWLVVYYNGDASWEHLFRHRTVWGGEAGASAYDITTNIDSDVFKQSCDRTERVCVDN